MSASERKESPLFVKTRDFQVWLFQHTSKFPRQYRHTLTERLERSALEFQRGLGRAVVLKEPYALAEADFELWQMRQLLRLAHELSILPASTLQFACEATAELGRLLGAWRAKGTGT
ncbi:MAG: four helix bundle protein [Verrucomicrobiota bacterium]